MPTKNKNPLESVELKVSLAADSRTAERIKALFPSAKYRNGKCDLKVVGERPADLAAKAEELMEKLREVVASPKDFKNAERSSAQN